MDEEAPLTRTTVSSLLRSHIPEEDVHSWCRTFSAEHDKPLLRVWTRDSGSQPLSNNLMQSRSPRQILRSLKNRRLYLKMHADADEKVPTPFISFTQSLDRLKEIAMSQSSKTNASQHVTVVDPFIRRDKGLPTINMGSEMRHYRVLDLYGTSYSNCDKDHLCLWEVTPEEIVGHWRWDVFIHPGFYEEVLMPAFRSHRMGHRMKNLDRRIYSLTNRLPRMRIQSYETIPVPERSDSESLHPQTPPDSDESDTFLNEDSSSYSMIGHSSRVDSQEEALEVSNGGLEGEMQAGEQAFIPGAGCY